MNKRYGRTSIILVVFSGVLCSSSAQSPPFCLCLYSSTTYTYPTSTFSLRHLFVFVFLYLPISTQPLYTPSPAEKGRG